MLLPPSGRRPATHPDVDLLRLAVAEQRLQPVDVVAIHLRDAGDTRKKMIDG